MESVLIEFFKKAPSDANILLWLAVIFLSYCIMQLYDNIKKEHEECKKRVEELEDRIDKLIPNVCYKTPHCKDFRGSLK